MRISALFVAVLAALAGCGGGEKGKVREVMERVTEAIARGDGEAACRELTAEAQRLVVISAEAVARAEFRSCAAVLSRVADNLTEDAARALRDADYRVELRGDGTALADSEQVTGEAQLRKQGGRWVVTRLNFGS